MIYYNGGRSQAVYHSKKESWEWIKTLGRIYDQISRYPNSVRTVFHLNSSDVFGAPSLNLPCPAQGQTSEDQCLLSTCNDLTPVLNLIGMSHIIYRYSDSIFSPKNGFEFFHHDGGEKITASDVVEGVPCWLSELWAWLYPLCENAERPHKKAINFCASVSSSPLNNAK